MELLLRTKNQDWGGEQLYIEYVKFIHPSNLNCPCRELIFPFHTNFVVCT